MYVFSILATLVVTVTAKDSYLVLSPINFRPGIPLNISVNILKANTSVTVEADLAVGDSKRLHTIASARGSFSQGSPNVLQINVPDNLQSGNYKLRVNGTGPGLKFNNSTDITFESKSVSIFIQTDRARYKPGQTVNFRAFAIHPDLKVVKEPMAIDITDPNKNKIKQWRGEHDVSGVVTKYLDLDTQPVIGDWKIKVTCHNETVEKVFEVAQYVLPKFEVTVNLPSFILTSAGSISGSVKAKYTYGKPVNGTVTLRARLNYWYRPYHYHGAEPIITQTFKINGNTTFNIPLQQLQAINQYYSYSSHYNYLQYKTLVIDANVTENLNRITLNGSSKVQFYKDAIKLEFLKSNPTTFKPGLPYTAYLKVVQQDDTPTTGYRRDVNVTGQYSIVQKPVTSKYGYQYSPRTYSNVPSKMYSVPSSGIVAIQVKIPDDADSFTLTARYGKELSRTLYLSKSESPSNSFMQLFLRSSNLRAGQTANFAIQATEAFSNAVYQVMSRGSVVSAGPIAGKSFDILITDKMAPNARIIVYYIRANGEVVTDSISFDVEGAFLNQVSINFDKTKAQPHENVNVVVSADPASTVNLLAVDQSVLLMKSGNDVTAPQVIEELKSYDTISRSGHGGYVPFGGMGIDMIAGRKRMVWWGYPMYYGGSTAAEIFGNAGVKVMTDATVYGDNRMSYPDYYFGPPLPMVNALGGSVPKGPPGSGSGSGSATHGGSAPLKAVDRIRNVFPETWLWTNATTGVNGTVTISTTVPDTITSWVASAFAVNSQSGLGVSPAQAKIEAFRPFFVSLNLPYSVVRGEELALQANVFNYMTQDLNVFVTLPQSPDYRNIISDALGNTQYVTQDQIKTINIAAGEAKSVFFPIVPAALGPVEITVKAQSTLAADAVQRQLLVEPEGVHKEYSNPILIDLKNSSSFSNSIPLSLPTGVVTGSERAVVTAIGDLMGPTLNGLNNLLRMPWGCGEQTMVNFAPDVFITNYLKATNQLTGAIRKKAIKYMDKGYQRELTYQHKDGSFSIWGDRDLKGSMWLTAFVVKSFHQAKSHIFIDEETIERAINWMIKHQKSDGRFPEMGHVHAKYLQGGAQSEAGLTAFVLVSLLENNDLDQVVQQRINWATGRAMGYLEKQLPLLTDTYVLSIATYALKLANSSMFTSAFSKLKRLAIEKDGIRHWHRVQTKPTPRHYHYYRPHYVQADPIDIEMTSYALLTYAAENDFAGGIPVMKWLMNQRNSWGGFGSTQDTVVGLQALSEFVQKIYSKNYNIHATINADNFTHSFSIDQQNALTLQSVVLPFIPSQVSVAATGNGFALLDLALSFNIEREIEQQSFELTVTLVNDTLDLLSIRTCSKLLGTGSSGMAVQEFGIPSGFEADLESIAAVTAVKRTETEDRKVILYFDQITATPTCLQLDVIRTGLVTKSQPAAIRLYDYYQPSNQVTQFYNSTVLQNSGICSLCVDCGC